ncbi:DUF4421 family protein [Formosa haliotis]|uniref:DUF4421 family protein n=1 Tax=Formosa haliotis TaxID=1555194 RepID=UPI000824941C|nr:DUF4421 family protein [Formosa haliotis]
MILKSTTFYLLFFITTYACFAQKQTQKDSLFDKENEYVRFYKNRITARVFYVNTSNSLSLNDDNSQQVLNLNANKQSRIGASVFFRMLTISYSFAPNFLNANKNNEDSKLYALNLRGFYKRRWMQTIKLYNEKGFFLKNDNYNIYLPKTKSFQIGGSTSYILNDNFSYRAIASQNEKQLKSAGSFVPSITYFYSTFNINSEDKLQFNTIDKDFKSFDLAFSPAYYYNYVPNQNLFISAGASLGVGLNHASSNSGNLTTLLTEFSFKATATYDFENLYFGAHFNYLILNHSSKRDLYITDNIPFSQVFIGYRFRAPQKVIKTAEDFNEKLNIKS